MSTKGRRGFNNLKTFDGKRNFFLIQYSKMDVKKIRYLQNRRMQSSIVMGNQSINNIGENKISNFPF